MPRLPVYLLLLAVTIPRLSAAHPVWLNYAARRIPAASPAEQTFWWMAAAEGYRAIENYDVADSFYTLASDAALSSGDDALRFAVWRRCVASVGPLAPRSFQGATAGLKMLARQDPTNLQWQAVAECAVAAHALKSGDTAGAQIAIHNANRALEGAQFVAPDEVELLLQLAAVQDAMMQKAAAFSTYLDARQLAAEAGDPALQAKVATVLARFASLISDHERAEIFTREAQHYDTLAGSRAWVQWDHERMLANSVMRRGDLYGALPRLRRIADWALLHNDRLLVNDALTTLRTGLLEAKDYKTLRDIYYRDYPKEVSRAERENPFLYHRLKAAFALADADTASALRYYAAADSAARASNIGVFPLARFRQMWGEALRSAGRLPEAERVLTEAYSALSGAGYPIYTADAAEALDSVARIRGDYRAAYAWALIARDARAAAQQTVRADEMLRTQMASEDATRARLAQKAEEERTRSHTLQYTGIVLAIIAAFIVILLLRSAHVSPRTLRIVSFLSFVLLFEFIILIADLFFHGVTHGEPWILILIKLVFIAGLSQVHHWMEHKLTHYLSSHEPLHEWRARILSWWKRPTAATQTTTAPAGIVVVEGGEASREESEAEIL